MTETTGSQPQDVTTEPHTLKRLQADLVPIVRSEDIQEDIASCIARRDAKFKGR